MNGFRFIDLTEFAKIFTRVEFAACKQAAADVFPAVKLKSPTPGAHGSVATTGVCFGQIYPSQWHTAIHLRQPTDTSKGRMWHDVGLDSRIFEIDGSAGKEIAARVVEIGKDLAAARKLAAKAREFARRGWRR
ncbi:MAG: hypothetical protein ACR2OZ_15725 [Verrucomicrobiales bacterium]